MQNTVDNFRSSAGRDRALLISDEQASVALSKAGCNVLFAKASRHPQPIFFRCVVGEKLLKHLEPRVDDEAS